jgi:nitrate reductase NapE component
MRRVRYGQLLALIVLIVLFPTIAHAHSGKMELHVAIVLMFQLIAGPAFIILARIFEGRRRIYLVGFFLGVVCSWAFAITGRWLGISDETYDALIESRSIPTIVKHSGVLFYTNLIGIPIVALAVVWAIYALRKKYLAQK